MQIPDYRRAVKLFLQDPHEMPDFDGRARVAALVAEGEHPVAVVDQVGGADEEGAFARLDAPVDAVQVTVDGVGDPAVDGVRLDDGRDLQAEAALQLRAAHGGLLHHVMEHAGRHDGGSVAARHEVKADAQTVRHDRLLALAAARAQAGDEDPDGLLQHLLACYNTTHVR